MAIWAPADLRSKLPCSSNQTWQYRMFSEDARVLSNRLALHRLFYFVLLDVEVGVYSTSVRRINRSSPFLLPKTTENTGQIKFSRAASSSKTAKTRVRLQF